jgi:hypothetical protein
MNERIRELADQALKECDAAKERGIDQYSKRLAELIVRECASICMKNQYEGTPLYNNGSVSSAEFIKEHFGVEE